MSEAVSYFKSKEGFKRFMCELRKKYEKNGKFSGMIKLKNISEIEKRDLEKFFGESYKLSSDVSISVNQFNRKMANTKFAIGMYDLVREYFGLNEIITITEKKHMMEDAYVDYLNDVFSKLSNREFRDYLVKSIMEKRNTSKIIRKRYKSDKNQLSDMLLKMDKLFCNIPKEATSIPMFASITGNPHFLDFNTSSGSLFIRFLSEMRERKVETLEEKIDLLESINVYNDTLSNQTLTYNLLGNEVLEKFNGLGPVSLNLDNINCLDCVRGIGDKIFIFENPSMLNYFKGRKVSVIITSGIPNLSFYRILSKVSKNTRLYYNGDYDPEGLVIANKIKLMFPFVNLFCYSERDYYRTKPNEKINESRLHKLEGVNSFCLYHVKLAILNEKMAGYQENNIKNIEKFVFEEMSKVKNYSENRVCE